jgi:hypothetical protein
LPREVNFCPYCGTGQHAGVDNPAHVARPPQAMPPAAAFQRAGAPAPAPQQTLPPDAPAVAAAASVKADGRPPVPPGAKPTKKERGPVRLRWWLLLLAIVLGAWIADKPRKVEARIDRAIALGADCRLNDAQAELIALRDSRATAEQLQRLQQGINEASVKCERKEQREKAWRATVDALDALLDKAAFARAEQRLQVFVRKWGDDSETRRRRNDIAAAKAARSKADAERLDTDRRDCIAHNRKWIENNCW